jgi:hypothetical protein
MIVLQPWLDALPLMQQTVLLTAIRGPDGLPKYGPAKKLLRWYRRCILLSAMDQAILSDPLRSGGGSFTGPSIDRDVLISAFIARRQRDDEDYNQEIIEHGEPLCLSVFDDRNPHAIPYDELVDAQLGYDGWQPLMNVVVDSYLCHLDAIPHHFQLHFMHAAEILGYKHPVSPTRQWWNAVYLRLVHDMHLYPEPESDMDLRLGDDRAQWLARADPATAD